MKHKTLVNIIDSESPIAAFLFLKERYVNGDNMMFIASNEDKEVYENLLLRLGIPKKKCTGIVLSRQSDSYTYERICRRIVQELSHDQHYEVNLAGGTRYMALAVQHVFSDFDAKFFYTQSRENLIVETIFDNSIYDNDDVFHPIETRMSLSDYFSIHGLEHDLDTATHKPVFSEVKSKSMLYTFAESSLTNSDYQAITLLRENYRQLKMPLSIIEMSTTGVKNNPPIPNLKETLKHLGFETRRKGVITPEEVEYITGGWFEEYTYYLLRKRMKPDQIAMGVHIAKPQSSHDNELDVVFIKNNHLFVIECKTGVQTDRLFHEIVYKACALRESLLGLACHSYIFSLKKDHDHHLAQTAQMMDIRFCDYFTLSSTIFNRLINSMNDIAMRGIKK